jgi:hypothetical protein
VKILLFFSLDVIASLLADDPAEVSSNNMFPTTIRIPGSVSTCLSRNVTMGGMNKDNPEVTTTISLVSRLHRIVGRIPIGILDESSIVDMDVLEIVGRVFLSTVGKISNVFVDFGRNGTPLGLGDTSVDNTGAVVLVTMNIEMLVV